MRNGQLVGKSDCTAIRKEGNESCLIVLQKPLTLDSLKRGAVHFTQAERGAHFDCPEVSSVHIKARISLNQVTIFLEDNGSLTV